MTKTIIVTGCAGFIGSHLTESLLSQGHQVIGIDNLNHYYSTTRKEANLSEIKRHPNARNFTFCKGDIRDKDFLDLAFSRKPVDHVIHLAAMAGVRYSIQNPKLYFDVNVLGTLNVLETMRKYNLKKLCVASSSSVYGAKAPAPFHEQLKIDEQISPYAASKKGAENLCHTYHHLFGISMAVLRFFTVYGPRGRPDMAPFIFTDAIANGRPIKRFGDGSTRRDYTFVKDIVAGILGSFEYVTQNECYEVFNLGNSNTVALSDFISTVEQVVGKQAIINQHPAQPGDVPLTNADISKSAELIGFSPKTNIGEGLAEFYSWYKEHVE